MKSIREQAEAMGHEVVGRLQRIKDDVYKRNGKECRNRMYRDSEGTEYAINWRGDLVFIAGEDWVI